MPISYHYKKIFIHIPKCAGTSIEKMLAMASEEELFSYKRVYFMKTLSVDRSKFTSDEYTRCVSKTPQHLTLRELKKVIPNETFDSFSKFSVVRNPFTRLISEFKYNTKNCSLPDVTDFPSMLDYLTRDIFDRNHRFDGHLETQTSFLIDETGKLDESVKVFRFENINECFEEISKISPIKYPVHSRKSQGSDDWKEYYTPELADLVRNFYRDDFINFNYSMDL